MRLRRILLLLLALALGACGDNRSLELTGQAMGTTFNVVLVEPPESIATDELETELIAVLQSVDQLASTWRDDSELTAFNLDLSIDWIPVSKDFCALLESALEVSTMTGGAFDLTIGPLTNLWGFGPDGQITGPPSDDEIAAAKHRVGFDLLEADCAERLVRKDVPDLYVDLSGWAKGYAVDQLAELLDARGIENYLVEIGGELRVRGKNRDNDKWAIGIEAPSTSARVPHAILRVTDNSVATSGDYRNYFEHDGQRFSHTIDARTGRPVTHNLAAVTVVNPSTAYADAMATALLVLGPEDGPQLARELGIAGYFLVRNQTGVNEITTPDFDTLSAL
ncbi:MAG: FAD:protein FMN transferase ApbE [Gammaproteobacteria bacterium]|jgi:thiamine biosynthesis lipoprotein|nr:FAD:protein FMN transferase ApbE [Gammaproteobacteria bacterium]